MPEPLIVRRETQIAAPPATVFAFLTDPEKILSWMGGEVTTEPHPGGLYLVKRVGGRNNTGRTARGEFREVVPVHRLAYTFGWEELRGGPPGSTLVEIDLIERDGGTLVRFTHSGLPNEAIVCPPRRGLGALCGPAGHCGHRPGSRHRSRPSASQRLIEFALPAPLSGELFISATLCRRKASLKRRMSLSENRCPLFRTCARDSA